ncbi:MAG: prolipoprotein diacylglyceryl transferase [Betaproteobacteria bacterium]
MYVHDLNPIALQIGPLAIRWYGLMYLVGFAMFLGLGHVRARDAWRGMSKADVDDLLFWGVVGAVVGGRLGHVLFYEPQMLWHNPLEMFAIWKGGMASHGGILGVILVMWLFARSRGKSFLRVCDFVVPLVGPGLAAGRIGNFINGELWGRVADPASVPWAMILPGARDGLPRHPSQLYQAALEGLLLWAILWWFSRKPRTAGVVGCMFLICYGSLRIVGEFFREPDLLYGTLPLGLSAGQWYSLPMVVAGVGLMVYFESRARRQPAAEPASQAPVKRRR